MILSTCNLAFCKQSMWWGRKSHELEVQSQARTLALPLHSRPHTTSIICKVRVICEPLLQDHGVM